MSKRQAVSLDRGDPDDDLDYGDALEEVRRPSTFIRHLNADAAVWVPECVLLCRASDRSEDLDSMIRAAKADLRKLGVRAKKTFAGVETSCIHSLRPLLEAALAYARKHDFPLVAPSRQRLLRARAFLDQPHDDRTGSLDRLSGSDLWMWNRRAEGVDVFTLLPPDESERPIRTAQGIAEKRRPCGPGELKTKNSGLVNLMVELLRDGLSDAETVQEAIRKGGERSTMYRRLKEAKQRLKK